MSESEANSTPLWLRDPPPKLKLDQFKLELLPFQNSGAIFLAQVANSLLRDSTGLGKCPQSLAAYNALVRKNPKLKCIVICPASLTNQWCDEINKFTTFKSVLYKGTKPQRKQALKKFVSDTDYQVLVMNYEIMRRDVENFLDIHRLFPFIVVYDEAQKMKNHRSQTAKAAKAISLRATGNKLLTATPIFNNVSDLFGLFKIIDPSVFGAYTDFLNNFATYYEIDRPGYSIPIVTGAKNIELLKYKIKPYVFGREKKDVYEQLPALTFIDRTVEMPEHHQELYDALAESNLLIKEDETSEVQKLASLVHMQRCTDAIEHINTGVAPSHPKVDECINMIEEEFGDEKIIVYSKFTSTIDILVKELNKKKIPNFVIDGRVSADQRHDNKGNWENHKGKAVLIISSAGGAGLNLQESGTIIFINHPWSYGEILQVWGRIHRIGTKHNKLLIVNIYVKDSIDEDIRDALKSKQNTFNRLFLEGKTITTGVDLGSEVWEKARARAIRKI